MKILNINLLLKKINNKKVYNKIFNSFRYSTYINKNTFKSKSIIDICINKIKNKLIYENKKDKNAKKLKIIIKELISELKVKLNSNENNKLNYGIQYSPENKYYNLFYNYYLLSFIKDIINNQQYSSIEKLFENYYPYIKNKSNYLLNVKDLFNFFNYFSDNIIKVYPLKKIQENNNNNNNNNNINKVFYSSVNRNDYKNIIDFNNLNEVIFCYKNKIFYSVGLTKLTNNNNLSNKNKIKFQFINISSCEIVYLYNNIKFIKQNSPLKILKIDKRYDNVIVECT